MKIHVANKDRSADLGREISAAAASLSRAKKPGVLSSEHSALSLRDAASEQEYLDRLLKLAAMRCGLETTAPEMPARRGPLRAISRVLKKVLWRVMKYQHDRMAFQQVLISEVAVNALAYQHAAQQRDVALLEARMAELERRVQRSSGPAREVGSP